MNITTTVLIKGNHCNSCKLLIEDVCAEMPGVKSCKVDFNTGKTVIIHERGFDIKKFKTEIEKLGEYTVQS